MIAAKHDPRGRPVMDGFDDDRLDEYRSIQLAIAAMAARTGDDAAAQVFLITMPCPTHAILRRA
jgi:hypothetical protein